MRLIFIRHGDPDYEKDSLTEKGWREAELLSQRVSNWDVKDFYCSPLGRAKDTAAVSLNKLHREATVCDWLKEFFVLVKDPETGRDRIPWDFMPEYWTKESLLYDKEKWVEAPVMKTGELKKSYKEVCNGIDELLATYGYNRKDAYYITEEGNDATIVFFCHLGLMFTVMSHLLNIAPTLLWHGFFVAPTSVTILNTEERVPGKAYFRCQVMGDTTHLHDGNEPISKSGYFTELFQN